MNKIVVRVTLEDGNSWITCINTDLKGARDYYLGKMWSSGSSEDFQSMAISVDLV